MPNILIVDDRTDTGDMLVEQIENSLPESSSWTVEFREPFPNMEDYPSYILENDVAVIVVDEKLHERTSESTKEAVQYDGHNLIEFLRRRFKELPIFVVTSFAQEDDLVDRASDVEAIISREGFTKELSTNVSRLVRSGQRFSDAMRAELSAIAVLAEKAASKYLTPEEQDKLNAIRQRMLLTYPSDAEQLADILPKATELVDVARGLIESLQLKIRRN